MGQPDYPNMKNTSSRNFSRRHFIATTGAAIVLPLILPGCATGRARPSKRITLGVVGWGMQGPGNTKSFLSRTIARSWPRATWTRTICRSAVDTINEHYENKDCAAYHDYREMMARQDIDAVMLAVPDHWHALVATEAARHKKDIYGEKPLARTIAEQQAIVHAVAEEQDHLADRLLAALACATFRKAAEIVRNGLIGKVTHVEVGLPAAIMILPGPHRRCWRNWPRCRRRFTVPDQSRARHRRLEARRHASRRPNWITRCGSARRRWSLTSRRAST